MTSDKNLATMLAALARLLHCEPYFTVAQGCCGPHYIDSTPAECEHAMWTLHLGGQSYTTGSPVEAVLMAIGDYADGRIGSVVPPRGDA